MSLFLCIRFVCVALVCLGLAMPTSLFAGCCGCCKAIDDAVGQQAAPIAKSCCGGKAQQAKAASSCLPGSPCTLTRTCPSCQAHHPVLIGEKQTSPTLPQWDDQPLSLAWEVSIPLTIAHEVTTDPPLDSHNARQSQICVWRK